MAAMGGGIAQRLATVRERIERACARANRDPANVTLVAVSKGQPVEAIVAAIQAGSRDFGENRVQEATAKLDALMVGGQDLRMHLIGHLQTNKVRDVIGRFAILHAIDSERLLRSVSQHAGAQETCLLEVNVAQDRAKFGFALDRVAEAVALARSLGGVRLAGLMTVPPREDDPERVRPHFRALRLLAEEHGLPSLSMGMTEDFEVAVEEGATHVRVGRAIFGERPV
jgi:pyridoxal phosphate enzyme (YggS family)